MRVLEGGMPYVRDGAVVSRRSPYRLSIVTDTFWSVVNLIAALCVPNRPARLRSRRSFVSTRLALTRALPSRRPIVRETVSSP